MKKLYVSIAVALFGAFMTNASQQARVERTLEKGWKFTREDNQDFARPDYNDAVWQSVTIPHDWAVYGPFSWQNDMQKVAIAQDGQKEAMEHAGRTGGLPFVGTGWYRTEIDIPEFTDGRRSVLMFDGAMSQAKVYVNGKEVGFWPYGYNTFYFDITPYLNKGEKNSIAVRLENLPESSRWYPGAGLYRNVHLITTTADAHVPVWGTKITTPQVGKEKARVVVETEVELPAGASLNDYKVQTEIISPDSSEVGVFCKSLADAAFFDGNTATSVVDVANPQLWDLDTPALYTAVTKVIKNDEVIDSTSQPFGIRTIEVRPDEGFFLNGRKVKFQGVCQHHDLGMLGAAVNEAAIRRQIRILKDMGANAIRTSHNMPAPELVKAADEMGIMLMVETFDEWDKAKCKNGYNLFFDEWVERDLSNVVRHYRNNPSVVMWCIGNEVPNQWEEGDCKTALRLQNIVKKYEDTRTVTQGMDAPDAVVNNNFAAVMEVPGFNYRPFKYDINYAKLPQRVILGSETASTVSSRGVYKFPVERKAMAVYDDHQSSGYDVEHCGWSNLPEDDFIWHEDRPFCMGEFVWTGFDYLGEPTPYYTQWPSHSSLFGIIDLAGIPKDRYYLYRSHWNKDVETLHILPHWTWPGREGEVTPVFVYTNYPEAELFINGKSQGRMRKDLTVSLDSTANETAERNFERQRRYRLMWMDTKYEPGTLRVVAYDNNGNPVAEKEVRTAGKPHHIELVADRDVLKADGRDLSFINVRVVDK
ncbi:MAG: DUF4982 domain-containing protein, partial [Muribaculaceae bacterium]|nr:DUF4982 domain-containing protein [Muribaculaceae bacterium]